MLPDILPGIELRVAINRLGGRDALVVKQLKRFAAEQAQVVSAIVAQSDLAEAQRMAHSLKGMAATLGCDALAAASSALEQQLKSGPVEQANALFTAVQRELDVVCDSVKQLPDVTD